MPDKKTLMVIGVTAVVVLIFASKIRQIPLVNKIPTA